MDIKVGTIDTNIGPEREVKPRSHRGKRLGTAGGRNSGGGGNQGGPNNNGGDLNFPEDKLSEDFRPNKYRVGMWFLLVVVLMTFGGLIAAYVVIATNGVIEWTPFDLPKQIWVSTVLIAHSSMSYEYSRSRLFAGDQKRSKRFLLVTTILGAAFISSQLLSWLALADRGVYMQSNPYAGFFYVLTAIHALHVFGGICVLGYMVLQTWKETRFDVEMERRKTISTVVGWYWHFMGGLWIVLVLLLSFWK